MMRWKTLVVLMLVLWQALQPAAALLMPFCTHPAVAGRHVQPDGTHEPDAASLKNASAPGENPSPFCARHTLCHLIAAPAVLSLARFAAIEAAVERFARDEIRPVPFVPDPPEHPPRHLFV